VNYLNPKALVVIAIIGAIGAISAVSIGISGNTNKKDSLLSTSTTTVKYQKIQIQILRENDKQPLSNVLVNITSGAPAKEDRTDSSGYVAFQVPEESKRVRIIIRKQGFEEITGDLDLKSDSNETTRYYLHPNGSKSISRQQTQMQTNTPIVKKKTEPKTSI
jgi:type II secretory pathway pseudopilin PulG